MAIKRTLFCVFIGATVFAQTPPSLKPGRVEGLVLNSITEAPVRKASISMGTLSSARSYVAVTDAIGHFEFSAVVPGTYVIDSVVAAGYSYSSGGPGTRVRIVVGEDQHIDGIKLRALPLAALNGRVTDAENEALSGVNVQALHYTYTEGGIKQLTVAKSAQTDDRGEYRLFGLAPGHYMVRAILRSAPELPSYDIAYYPSGDFSQASPIELAGGEDRASLDFRLRKIPVFHIRGRIANPAIGSGVVNAQPCKIVVPLDNSEKVTARVQPDGQFDFAGLRTDSYCLSSLASISDINYRDRSSIYASATVSVTTRDVDGVSMTPAPAPQLQGVVQVEGQLDDPLKYMSVRLLSTSGSGGGSTGRAKGEVAFTMDEVTPDTYRIQVNGLASGAYVRSIEFERRDIPDGVLTVTPSGGTLTLHIASGSGDMNMSVQNEKGGPAAEVAVVVAAVSRVANAQDAVRLHVTDENGHAEVHGLPPGDYRVFAIPDDDEDAYLAQSADFLRELGGSATSVSIRGGGGARVDLKMVPADEVRRIKTRLQ